MANSLARRIVTCWLAAASFLILVVGNAVAQPPATTPPAVFRRCRGVLSNRTVEVEIQRRADRARFRRHARNRVREGPDRRLLQRHVARLRDDRQHPWQLEHGVLELQGLVGSRQSQAVLHRSKPGLAGIPLCTRRCSISGRTRSGT